jgi:hypothetical protein
MSDVNGHAGQEPIEDGGTDSIYIYIWPIINGLREYPQNIWPEIWYYVTCEVYIWRKMGIFVHSELLVYPRLIVKKWGYRWI